MSRFWAGAGAGGANASDSDSDSGSGSDLESSKSVPHSQSISKPAEPKTTTEDEPVEPVPRVGKYQDLLAMQERGESVDEDLLDYYELLDRQERGEELTDSELGDMEELAADLGIDRMVDDAAGVDVSANVDFDLDLDSAKKDEGGVDADVEAGVEAPQPLQNDSSDGEKSSSDDGSDDDSSSSSVGAKAAVEKAVESLQPK